MIEPTPNMTDGPTLELPLAPPPACATTAESPALGSLAQSNDEDDELVMDWTREEYNAHMWAILEREGEEWPEFD